MSRMSAMPRFICSWPAASWSTLCRTATRPSDTASSCRSRSEEEVAGATGAVTSGAVCGMDSACGTAIISLEDREAKIAATTVPNVIKKTIASEVRSPSDSCLVGNRSFFESAGTGVASTNGLVDGRPAENPNRVGLGVELIGTLSRSLGARISQSWAYLLPGDPASLRSEVGKRRRSSGSIPSLRNPSDILNSMGLDSA